MKEENKKEHDVFAVIDCTGRIFSCKDTGVLSVFDCKETAQTFIKKFASDNTNLHGLSVLDCKIIVE